MREASGREIDGKTELSFSSQMGVGGGGGGAGAEKAKLGRLWPAAHCSPHPKGNGMLREVATHKGLRTPSLVTVLNKGPGSPSLSLGPTPPLGGAVEVWAEGTPCRVGV